MKTRMTTAFSALLLAAGASFAATDSTDYAGGMFKVESCDGHRYEAEAGTTAVKVQIGREASAKGIAATNKLVACRPDGTAYWSKDVIWATNGMSKTESVPLADAGFTKAGQQVKLVLQDASGVQKDVNSITFVELENSVKNPLWIGKEFDYGEWTMDFVAATNKSASVPESFTLVAVTGALWCPDCKKTDENFLDLADENGINRFRAWAKQRNINLVTIDVPNFKSEKPSAESPTLLSRKAYTTSLGTQSGLGYLSRKEVSDAEAKRIIERNHRLVSASSETSMLRRPEDRNQFRTGVPIFVLLRADGTVGARLTYLASKSPTEEDRPQWDNIIKRFEELLELAQTDGTHYDDIDNNHFSVTKDSLFADGGVASAEISHCDSVDVYKLEGISGSVSQKIKVTGSGSAMVKVQIINDENTFTNAVATGKLSDGITLESELPEGSYFVSISANNVADDEFSYKNAAAGNYTGYKVEASYVLAPAEKIAKAVAAEGSDELSIRLTAGTRYRFSGIADGAQDGLKVVSAENGIYEAVKTGTCVLKLAQAGGEVSYQVWRPGKIGFVAGEQLFIERNKTGVIKVERTDGSSGESVVQVTLSKTLSDGRLEKPAGSFVLVWADGESGEKTIEFAIKADAVVQETDTFVLTLSAGETCSAEIGATTHTVTVLDTDKPVLDEVRYAVRCFPGFAVNRSYPVHNILEDGRVLLHKVSGKLPMGLSLKYDKTTKCVVLSGTPHKAVENQAYCFTISEKRASGAAEGLEIQFMFNVVEPSALPESDSDYNAVVGKAVSLDVPMYAKFNGKNVLGGLLDLSVSAKNRITARLTGAGARTITFSGNWQKIENGVVSAVLKTDKKQELELALSRDGFIFASVTKITTDFGKALASDEAGVSAYAEGEFEPYAGYYTVTLPVNKTILTETPANMPLGTGYLVLKMNSSSFKRTGRVSYSGKYANGSSFGGNAYLVPNAYADGCAQLCIMKSAGGKSVGLVLKIKPNAAQNYANDPMTILADGTTMPYWKSEDFMPVNVYGGYYDSAMDMLSCCADVYNTETFVFECDMTGFAQSEAYGAFTDMPQANVIVGAKSFVLEQPQGQRMTVKLVKRTGIVSGRIPLQFANGRKMTSMFYGVLLPHWYDCGCSDTPIAITMINRPFFSGFVAYPDFIGGVRVKRGFAVDFNPVIEGE